MNKLFLLSGSILGFLGVSFGAFGAHALKELLKSTNRADTFETAIKYMFYHAVALIFVGILAKEYPGKHLIYSGNAFLIGVILFSGSLLVLSFTGIKIMGAIAPIGGVALLIGWAFLFWTVYKG